MIRTFNSNLFSPSNFQNPTSGSKVMIAVNRHLKQIIAAVTQLLKMLTLELIKNVMLEKIAKQIIAIAKSIHQLNCL